MPIFLGVFENKTVEDDGNDPKPWTTFNVFFHDSWIPQSLQFASPLFKSSVLNSRTEGDIIITFAIPLSHI